MLNKIGVLMAMLLCSSLLSGIQIVPQAMAKIGDGLQISSAKTTLYAGPSTDAAAVMTLTKRMKLIEMERQSNWVLVTVRPSGVQGWILKRHLHAAKRAKHRHHRLARSAKKALSALGPVQSISLDDMGFHKGHTFRGSQAGHAQSFFFETPMDSKVRGGAFRLNYRASSMLHRLSNLSVFVNDIPLTQLRVKADNQAHEEMVILPSSVFRGGMVKITIEAGTLVHKNRCLDVRSGGGFLHILPNTSLDITYSSINRSIRDAWRMLPHKVVVSLPAGKLDEGQFAAAMSVMELLSNAGREVAITRLPELGDIVVATKANVVSVLNARGLKKRGFVKLQTGDVFRTPNDNLNLIRSGRHVAIAVSEPYDVQPLYLVDKRWALLSAGRHYDVNKPDRFYSLRSLPKDSKSNFYSMPLAQLDTAPHYISRETVWSTTLSPRDLPSGTRLDMLNLNIIAPVRWDADPTYELYVFLNEVLVSSKRLENDGMKHNYSIPLPSGYQQQYNNLRFVVQHDIQSGDCFGILPTDFVQITPDTSLIVKAVDSVPGKFSSLAQYFSSGFDTYISDKYLRKPENVLYLISRMSSDLPMNMDYSKLHFLKEGTALDPKGPFLAVGNFNLDNLNVPVRMDKGPVEIRDKSGKSFFSVNVLPKITIAQIANAASSYGLVVMPSDLVHHKFDHKLRLVDGDVAFIDNHGVLLNIDSKQPTLAEVYYPDTQDWFAVLGQYRFWILAVLWFLLSLAIVYVYRLSRGQRAGQDHDVEMPTPSDLHMQRVHHTNINIDDDDDAPTPGRK